jgi:pyrimidine 5'-nucleotidase
MKYYKDYGLAIEGLVRHHKVDALDYNQKVDDALPLEDLIKPNPDLRRMLQDFDKTKIKLWLFTNAYITHGKRVVKLLEIEDLFEGITYCDYGSEKFICKPHKEAYEKAMKEAGVSTANECYFVGKSSCQMISQSGNLPGQMILTTMPKLLKLLDGLQYICWILLILSLQVLHQNSKFGILRG